MPSDRFNDLLTNDSKKVIIATNWNADGLITQHIEGLEPLYGRMTKWVMDSRDAGIRKALIDMGWTPPPTP